MESKEPLGFTCFIKTTIITTRQRGILIYLVNEQLTARARNRSSIRSISDERLYQRSEIVKDSIVWNLKLGPLAVLTGDRINEGFF